MSGWVAIHRDILNSDLWLSEKFTRGQAWIDLIMLANHKDGFFRKRGVRVDVKRGQVGYSELALSDRWNWSRGKVNRYLIELESDGNIIQQKTRLTTLITITKYDVYQSKQDNRRTTSDTTDGQQTDINNNDNNVNNDNKKEYIPPSMKDGAVPYQEIIDLYHKKLPDLPKVAKLTQKRKSQIKRRWVEDLTEIEHWDNYFDYISHSDFLMGKVAPINGHKVFRADIEWLTNQSNFTKISEEKYHG